MLTEEIVQKFQVGSFQPADGPRRGEVFQYRLLTPRQVVPGRKYPLIVFLHGAGERGTDNVQQLVHFPELMAGDEHRERYPSFVFAPQCLPEYRWVEVPWDATESSRFAPISPQMQIVLGMLDANQAAQPIDSDRIYVTGLSMGGYGCWDLAVRFPRRFAAVAPICGGGDEAQAARLTAIPIWAFHGELDDAVPVERSRRMIAAIRAVGGSPRYSELAGVGHHSWTPAYADPNGVIPWMFEQQKAADHNRTVSEPAAE